MSDGNDFKKAARKSTFGKNLAKALNNRAADNQGPPPPRKASPAFDSFAGRLADRLKAVEEKSALSQTDAADGPAQGDHPPQSSESPHSEGPVGGGEHVVKQGECLSSIARDTGHFWETLWNDAANAELRNARKDPNVILPDDCVHVPPLREKWEPRQTEMRHRFRRRGEPAMLRLTLHIDDVPLANEKYTLEVDGKSFEGVTDTEGKLQRPIPGNARQCRLIVGDEKKWEYTLVLGHIDPVESLAGAQKRLINLGFNCGRTDGEWDTRCREAVREFQKRGGLGETGELDDLTRRQLREVHGS